MTGVYKENYRFAHIEVSCVADFENGKAARNLVNLLLSK